MPYAIYGLDSPVKSQERAMGVVEVRASGRKETGFPLALCAKVALEALHCIHICSRAAKVRDVAGKTGQIAQPLRLFYN